MNELIKKIPPLSSGFHPSLDAGACIMEAVSFVAGEPWSDHPECVCPTIGAFLRRWNDALSNNDRDTLLRPLILLLPGTRAGTEIEQRRSAMAANWLIRVHTPAWLRLAKLDIHADALSLLPEITDFAKCPSLIPVLNAARTDADAAWAAAKAAARDVAWAAARDAAWDAAWAAAKAAARDVAWAAARDALKTTTQGLQQSALALVYRMIELGKST